MLETHLVFILRIVILLRGRKNSSYILLRFCLTGKYWYDKVRDVQEKMKKKDTSAHVVQSLDSIACK